MLFHVLYVGALRSKCRKRSQGSLKWLIGCYPHFSWSVKWDAASISVERVVGCLSRFVFLLFHSANHEQWKGSLEATEQGCYLLLPQLW